MPPITLTTDFGYCDAYVASMKGIILGINPNATIVDVCHSIEPQNVAQGAFLLSTVCAHFPRGTIHTIVVDPGVGTMRSAIVLQTGEACFVAPDNGLLSYVIHQHASPEMSLVEAGPTELPPGVLAVEITNPRFWRHPVSATFHGRDIFAPVAAHLSLGVPPAELGETISSVNVLPIPRPYVNEGGELVGHVLHIDFFGNVITDISEEDLTPGGFRVVVANQLVGSLDSTYADVEAGQALALIGSSGHLEISVRNGSAAGMLGVRMGDTVKIVRH